MTLPGMFPSKVELDDETHRPEARIMALDGTPGFADLLGWLTLFLGLAVVLVLAPKNRSLRLILVI